MRTRSFIVMALLTAAVAVACGGAGETSGDNAANASSADAYGERNPSRVSVNEVTVEMQNLQFVPQGIVVKPGTTVTWVNNDPVVHVVSEIGNAFQSQDEMATGDTFSYTFTKPGRYRYQCTYHHPNMNAVVIVEES